jgi:RNA ligase (TIGR02306 family)
MRKLASIRRIADIQPIEGADAIEVATIDGWKVVIKKGDFAVGDLAVYMEIDSWVPTELAAFLSKGQAPREYNGVKGERLRTIRLRGQVSQGLLLPLHTIWTKQIDFHKFPEANTWDWQSDWSDEDVVGLDVTAILGIQKWEAVLPAQLQGLAKGTFPSWGRKTDQERCQNIWAEIQGHIEKNTQFEVTIKLDGSSASYGLSPDGDYVACSRNLSLKTDQEGNTFVNVGNAYSLEEQLLTTGRPLLISGELCGPGIQKNQETLSKHQLFVFDVYDPVAGKYLSVQERKQVVDNLKLDHVPVLYECVTLKELGINSLDALLAFAEGSSLKAAQREGVVFKSVDGSFSFKSISNKWLLKNE